MISVVIIASTIIQIYWINNAISLGEEEFKKNVNNALEKVVLKLEREETLNIVKQHMGKKLIGKIDLNSNKLKLNLPGTDQRSIIRDTTISKDGELIQQKIIEGRASDTLSGFYAEHRVVTESSQQPKLLALPNNDDYFGDSISLELEDEAITNRVLLEKSHFVNEVVANLFKTSIYIPLEKRVSLKFLDSLLKAELLDQGIDAEYVFSIYNAKNFTMNFKHNCSENYDSTLTRDVGYHINIFPNDILQEANFLNIFFPKQKQYVLGQMWLMLLLSALLTIVIVYSFYYTISIFLKEKKLSLVKNDFINNMTHELKTPISTIALACEALNDDSIEQNTQTKKHM